MQDKYKIIDELKLRIAERDSEALRDLYKYYYKKLKLYGLQFSPKLISISLDDIIQNLFLWIAKNPHKLRDIENLEVYLFSALKNNIFQEISRNDKRKKIRNKYIKSANTNRYDSSPENKLIESEKVSDSHKFINNLLNTLPPKQREVLYLRNFLNMSYKEIGEIMNLSEQVVRNYAHRALQKMRKQPLTHSYKRTGKSDTFNF